MTEKDVEASSAISPLPKSKQVLYGICVGLGVVGVSFAAVTINKSNSALAKNAAHQEISDDKLCRGDVARYGHITIRRDISQKVLVDCGLTPQSIQQLDGEVMGNIITLPSDAALGSDIAAQQNSIPYNSDTNPRIIAADVTIGGLGGAILGLMAGMGIDSFGEAVSRRKQTQEQVQ